MCNLPAWKRNCSARLPQFLNWTTSKTEQFRESLQFLQLTTSKPTILRDVLKFSSWQHHKRNNSAILPSRMESWMHSTASCQYFLRFFHSIYLKCAKCCICHAKSPEQTWRSDAPKCNPSQEINALTSEHLWWTCLLYCAWRAKCMFADLLQMPHACQRFWNGYKTFTSCSLWTRCINPGACHSKRHLNVQNWSKPVSF